VEDDPVTRTTLVKLLTQLGHKVDSVATIAEGLRSWTGSSARRSIWSCRTGWAR